MIICGGYIETQQGNLYCASGLPNTAPTAAGDTYTAVVNKQLVVGAKTGVLVNDTDANGDLLNANAASSPAHGTLQFFGNGAFRYKPVAGFTGTDTFTYTASDGLANSNITTVQ